jgi:UDP-glucuronate 4-epimerase
MLTERLSKSDGARFLVTGAYGCIGAWVVSELVASGRPVVTFDLTDDPRRLRFLMDPADVAAVPHVRGDITDLASLERAIDEHAVSNVIHLAALQVPFCRADPPLGARVNVVGTVNVFETVKRRQDRMSHIVYASSVAAYDMIDESDALPTMTGTPSTLYGVFKRANEGSAWVYREDHAVSSVGLRPHTVYGLGRDQGVTSSPTTAMLAAATGTPYRIPYGGACQLQYGQDVARAFVATSLAAYEGASTHNVPGRRVTMHEVVEAIALAAPASAGTITFDDIALPFPEEVDGGSLETITGPLPETELAEGVRETIQRFRELLAAGVLAAPIAVETRGSA